VQSFAVGLIFFAEGLVQQNDCTGKTSGAPSRMADIDCLAHNLDPETECKVVRLAALSSVSYPNNLAEVPENCGTVSNAIWRRRSELFS